MKIKRRTSRADVPSMAMGDIAFNLLIFFVILARVQDDSHLKWTPAAAEKLDPAKQAKVNVLMDVNEKIYLNGREIGQAQLAGAIEDHLRGIPPGDRIVALKCHNQATAMRFQPVLEAIAQAGGDLVHILERRSKDE